MNHADWGVLAWDGFKDAFAPAGAAARTVAHIHVGLAIYLGVVALRGKGLRSWLGLLAVMVPALANEWMDLAVHGPPIPAWLWRDSMGDVISTLAWPILLFLAADWFSRREPRACEEAGESDGVASDPQSAA